MGKRSIDRGPVSRRVADNIRELRRKRGLTLQELSEQLTAAGRPIVPSGVGKIEQVKSEGARRVDVDDLVALALALDVSPVRLLLPATADEDEAVELTEQVKVSKRGAWQWARGEKSLYDVTAPREASLAAGAEVYRRHKEFPQVNRPDLTKPDARQLIAHGGDLQNLWQAAADLAEKIGCSLEEVLRLVPEAEITEAETREGDDDGGR